MKAWTLHDPALQAALIGMAGLATAMGIGRFAFTPMLPLMQLHDLISLRQGSYLASANYVGYLLGALLLFAFNPQPARAAKFGLAAVAVSTLAMAFTSSFSLWLVLRLIAGVASAFVLVGVSGWALAVLAAHDRPGWTGWVFAGVGAGILFAGAAVLAIGATDLAPAVGWIVLGAAACCVALVAALLIENMAPSMAADMATLGADASAWRLIVCYGSFGFGYIIPATFLPAAARSMISDPTVFGWIGRYSASRQRVRRCRLPRYSETCNRVAHGHTANSLWHSVLRYLLCRRPFSRLSSQRYAWAVHSW